jgi:hypothetical protein
MNILSIQSHVAYGHVGNAAAVFPLQRLGIEVWPIHTVQFSNHTGYGAWTGQVFDGTTIKELINGIAARGALPGCDGVLSGYMGGADIGAAILDAVAAVKAANPKALYCCDPVIGDIGFGPARARVFGSKRRTKSSRRRGCSPSSRGDAVCNRHISERTACVCFCAAALAIRAGAPRRDRRAFRGRPAREAGAVQRAGAITA